MEELFLTLTLILSLTLPPNPTQCLCHVAEPTFLGFCQAQGADCAVKTVAKLNAHESVGVLALVNGKVR